MAESIGSVALDLEVNQQGFNRQLNSIASSAQNSVGLAFTRLGGTIAAAFSVYKLYQFGRASVELASNLTEVQNVVDVTFGSMSNQINNFAKNALDQFGLAELSAKKYTSTMGAMLKSSGITGQGLVTMSENLTGLAADFASFYNISQDDAFLKIQAGISGEIEPLRRLGVNMTVANMQAYALSQGIKTQYQNMTQAQQAMLRYSYLLSVTKDAQGDFARTSGSWANQVRLLGEQWKIFETYMGQAFINILTPVLRGLNWLIAKLQIAAAYFKAFTDLIFGTSQTASSGSKGISDVGKSIEEAAGAAGGAGDKLKKAKKDIQGSVAAFDQLNVVGKKAADAMDGAAGAAGGLGAAGGGLGGLDLGGGNKPDLKVDPEMFAPVKAAINEVKELAIQAGQFLQNAFGPPLQAAFDILAPTVLRWKGALVDTFNSIATLGEPFKQWFTSDLIPYLQTSIVTASKVLNGLLDSALKVFNGVRDAALPILEWFVKSGLPFLTSFLTGAQEVFYSLFDAVKSIFDTIITQAVNPALKLISHIIIDCLNIIKGFWDKWGADIVSGLKGVFASIKELFDVLWRSFLGPIVKAMLEELTALWDNHLKGLVTEIGDFIGILVTSVLDIYNKFIHPIADFLIRLLGPAFSTAFSFIAGVIGTIIGVVADVAKGVIKSLGGIIEFLTGVFTGDWHKIWNGIAKFFGGIWDGITGIFKGAINLIIDAMNALIRGLNSISIDVPDWVPSIGGKKYNMDIPRIPKLATGGLVSGPTLAMVGDNRNAQVDPEVVTPLSKLQGMLDLSNRAVVEVLLAILDAIEGQQTTIEIDGEKLSSIIRGKMQSEDGRVGKSMVTIGGVPV